MLDWFLVWWLGGARYAWSKFRRRLFEGNARAFPIPGVTTLAEIESCLRQVTWVMDGPLHLYDSISLPETVWRRKKDDCDGFSVLAAALLHRWNVETRPVLITAVTRPVRSSHTVCAFHSTGSNLCYFDNASLRTGPYGSYGEIAAEISRNAKKLVCWDIREPATLAPVEFHRG
jgi:hypothetical protein